MVLCFLFFPDQPGFPCFQASLHLSQIFAEVFILIQQTPLSFQLGSLYLHTEFMLLDGRHQQLTSLQ